MSVSLIPAISAGVTPLELTQLCDGYYECLKDPAGKRLTPLAGYAGTYELGKQYVGDVFVNFAKIERYPSIVMGHVARPLLAKLQPHLGDGHVVFSGAPQGGLSLATLLGLAAEGEYGYPDKVIEALATESSREKSKLKYGRHEIVPSSQHVIVEDVCNNFSTTGKFIDLLNEGGGDVLAIASFLNRSMTHDDVFEYGGRRYPVIPLWREPMVEYRQDDPEVAEDIANDNVRWQPKKVWDELKSFG